MQSGKPRAGNNQSQIKRWLLLNSVLLALVGLLSLTYPIEELSRRISDLSFRLRGTQTSSRDVALVLIDDASLNRYGRWPWKRSVLARVVRAAAAEDPKALGLDILLFEAEDPSEDQEFADALKAAGNVVLASKISNSQGGRLWVEPLPLFAQNAVAIGHAQAVLGPDSICRSIPVQELTLEGPRWAFALEIARVARGAPLEDDGQYLHLGQTRIPIVGSNAGPQIAGVEAQSPRFLAINYRGQLETAESPAPFTAISAADLLEGKAHGQLQGKAVLIGFGSVEIADRVPTPVSGRIPMPGVEIHANLVDTILSGRGLRPLGGSLQVFLVFAFTLVTTGMVLRWPGWKGMLFLAALMGASYAVSYLLFAWADRLIAFGPFLCVGVLAGPMAQLQNLVTVDRSVTRGLHQLQSALRKTGPAHGTGSMSLALRAATPPGNLHWKINLLQELQSELSSLYSFDETLLNAMQDGLAVFASDGQLVFCNPRWQDLCAQQNENPAAPFSEFASMLNDAIRHKLLESLAQPDGRFDSEVYLRESLFHLRAMKLPAAQMNSTSPALILLVLTDFTARLERDRARACATRSKRMVAKPRRQFFASLDAWSQ
ncbi:MAG: hypothetical protein DMG40_00870 [Acidobacteria bacterium]|nr:MAG: hypothetical protein DMG40_00870 [Acidobacteriota bacterium]